MTVPDDDDLLPLPLPDGTPLPDPPDTGRKPGATGVAPTNTNRSAMRFQIANRRRQVAALVLRRLDERQIAKALGVSRQVVCKDKSVVIERWRASAERDLLDARAEAAAALDSDEQRLRTLYTRLEQRPDIEPALEVYDRILKIQERRAKLLGLDAPEQKEIRFPASWRGATVVRDEPRPRDAALAVLAVLSDAGAFEAAAGGSNPDADPVPALPAGSGDAVEARIVDPAPSDEVRADESDGETGRVSVAAGP